MATSISMEKLTITDKIKIFFVLAIAAVAICGIIWYCTQLVLDKYYLSKNFRYTIMTSINNGSADGRGHSRAHYNFIISSKQYSGVAGGSFSTEKLYFVKFYPPDPSRNEAVFIEATSYDIENLPPDGYKKLPHH